MFILPDDAPEPLPHPDSYLIAVRPMSDLDGLDADTIAALRELADHERTASLQARLDALSAVSDADS